MPKPESVRLPASQAPEPRRTSRTTSPTSSFARTTASKVYGGGYKVKTTIDLGLQKLAQRGDREGAAAVDRADCRARHDRRSHRRRARDGRRPELPPEPVQPRDPGRAPAGLGVQAVRARRGAASGDLAGDDVQLAPGHDRRRRAALERQQLRGRVPRADRPDQGDRGLGQHGLRAADEHRRAQERRPGGEGARDHDAASAVLRDRPRRRAGDAARDGARVRELRERRLPARRLDVRQRAASRSRASRERTTTKRNATTCTHRPSFSTGSNAAIETQLLQGVVSYGTGTAAAAPRLAGRRQDRHDRELRRRLVRRLHAADRDGGLGRVPEQAGADADASSTAARSPAARTRR